jgi:hypothetical protein
MIQPHRFIFFISILFTFCAANAQQEKELDTTKAKDIFGIRVGVDVSKPIIALFKEDSKGFEIVVDARVYKNFYAAIEFGHDNVTTIEDYLNFTSEGSYVKFGGNYNAYENWAGMTNEIYVGARYGLSFFNQTLNSYTPNIYGTYFVSETVEPNTEYTDLSAQWIEFILGIRAETLKNVYMGFSIGFKSMISSKEPENFQNLYIPGFYKVSLNNLGFGFNYTLTYLIPYAKK